MPYVDGQDIEAIDTSYRTREVGAGWCPRTATVCARWVWADDLNLQSLWSRAVAHSRRAIVATLALCAADAWAAARLRRGCAQGAAQARTARGADVLGSPSTQAAALRTPAHAGALTPLGAARAPRAVRA